MRRSEGRGKAAQAAPRRATRQQHPPPRHRAVTPPTAPRAGPTARGEGTPFLRQRVHSPRPAALPELRARYTKFLRPLYFSSAGGTGVTAGVHLYQRGGPGARRALQAFGPWPLAPALLSGVRVRPTGRAAAQPGSGRRAAAAVQPPPAFAQLRQVACACAPGGAATPSLRRAPPVLRLGGHPWCGASEGLLRLRRRTRRTRRRARPPRARACAAARQRAPRCARARRLRAGGCACWHALLRRPRGALEARTRAGRRGARGAGVRGHRRARGRAARWRRRLRPRSHAAPRRASSSLALANGPMRRGV